MKKIYALALGLVSMTFAANAQNFDVEITLDSPMSGSSEIVDNNYTISYTVTNNGPIDIPQGDTIVITAAYGGNNYTIDGVSGSVSLFILPADFVSGATFVSSTQSANFNLDLTGLNNGDDVCIAGGIGLSSVTSLTGNPNDTVPTNNVACFTVDGVASIETDYVKEFSVYPNPANENVTFNFAGANFVNAINIMGINGSLVKNVAVNGNGQVNVNVADLAKGFYVYQIVDNDGKVVKTAKFVKQ